MMQLPGTVSDQRGTFHTRVMARQGSDGRWEGWLEFIPSDDPAGRRYATPIETRQHDRVTLERWASGLTDVYADGALARAQPPPPVTMNGELLVTLRELVDALDRRVPHLERAGEAKIADEARQLRAAATERIALLQDRGSDWTS